MLTVQINEDVMVVSGDMLFNPKSFDAGTVVRFFEHVGGEVRVPTVHYCSTVVV